jgi:DNA mismatch repair ATPase MutS
LEEKVGFLENLKDSFSREGNILRLIRQENSREVDKERNYKFIRSFFDMSKKGEYTIDNQTWDDLNMDKVYSKLDRTHSTLGEEILYTMLRNPLMEEEKLKHRNNLIELFRTNKRLKERLQGIFFKLGKNHHNSFLEMIKNDLIINKGKYYFYTLIGKVMPCVVVLLAIFVKPQYILLLLMVSLSNITINMKETKEIRSNGIFYLRNIIKSAKKITNLNNKELTPYTDRIAFILKEIKIIGRGTKFIGFENMWGGVLEPISGALLLEECAYYAISNLINEKREYLIELYYLVGELEALISICNYQNNLEVQYIKPNFTKELSLAISEGVHPIVDEAVPNSIDIKNNGIVLTGTNMSGKSTFLRMLGVNMLLAQTFYFTLAKDYEACFFNIVSSISPNDDLANGKSFFMAEVESILRIINALEKEVPVFCPIDEIFRGTNPIERISMSAEILIYLNKGKSISIVATHDRELVEILKENYEFYYFSENVDSTKGLSFDYKLKRGVSQTRNAIKLLEYSSYPQVIIDNSYKRAESIEGFI